MKKKIKVFILLICISVVFCANTYAVSKNDIIGYVNSQTVCGDVGLFNRYKTTFTRLLKQKKLTEKELSTIYSYLQSSVGILNSKGVCKIADLGKLTAEEKSSVYNSLTAGANIITSAPLLQFGEEENSSNQQVSGEKNPNLNTNTNTDDNISNSKEDGTNTSGDGTKVTINTQDNTMDIYENGILVDKVSMSTEKMTYTGANMSYVVGVIICSVLFVLALVTFIMLAKKHNAKTRFVKNMLMSIMICSGFVGLTLCIFGTKIESLIAMIDLVSFESSDEEIQVELNADKSIKKYPSYGSNYATLSIEKLNINNKVYFGDITSILSVGVGHSTWSDMPTEGGTIVYSGHNREDRLKNLKDVKSGDKIVVETSYAKCTYEVNKTEILKDNRTDKLTQIKDEETLILYTCYPFDTYVYTDDRFVVYSVLKEIKWK